MMKHTTLLLSFLLSFCSYSSFAQDEDEKQPKKLCNEDLNKKAIKLYEKALDKKKYKKPERIEFLTEAIQLEPDFSEAHLRMGFEMEVKLRLDEKPYKPLIQPFMAAIKNCPQIHSEPYYFIGYAWYEAEKNDSAQKYLQKFLDFKDEDDAKFGKNYNFYVGNAKGMIKSMKKEATLKKGVPFNPKVVQGISTERDEYLTYVSPDDKKCFFVRKQPIVDKNQVYSSDREKEVFMIALRDKTGMFDKGSPMPEPFNVTDDNQGGCTISIDNKHLYFAMMKDEGGLQPNVDLYVSDNAEDYWTDIRKLSANVNHPKYWDSQPTIASDGLTLYFASDRPGGMGGIDIYVTKKDPKTGVWSIPQNLGPTINTKGNEKTPFIHSDSHTIYFSSDGQYGFGGYDIFYSRMEDNGQWAEPVNIGSPINGTGDDSGFFVSKDTKTAYFFSYNEGKVQGKGIGRYDMYSFDLYPEARPSEVVFFEGNIKDQAGEAVTGAVVEIKNTATKEKTYAVVDSASGKYMAAISIKKKDKIVITVKKDSVAFNTTVVDMKNVTAETKIPEVKLNVQKSEQGKSFVINDIHYKTNSAEIEEGSKLILQSFAEYLLENPNLTVEIQGHTDNVGNPKDNEALSSNRAFSVKAYIESFKVPGKRVSAKGYGQSVPIADNKTEAGRAMNRRTEFLIVEH